MNASLIGDAYLNFGLRGVAVVMTLYVAIVKTLYLQFRQGRLHARVYALAFIYSLQMMWASFEVWPQALTVFAFAFGLIFLGETVLRVRYFIAERMAVDTCFLYQELCGRTVKLKASA